MSERPSGFAVRQGEGDLDNSAVIRAFDARRRSGTQMPAVVSVRPQPWATTQPGNRAAAARCTGTGRAAPPPKGKVAISGNGVGNRRALA